MVFCVQFDPPWIQSICDDIHKFNPVSPVGYVSCERPCKKRGGLRNLFPTQIESTPLYLKPTPQLAPTFGSRGGGGGGGFFFEGTMGVCSARAWLKSSSSDEDGEADNGESSGEKSNGFPRCGTERSISADTGTTPFG